MAEESVIVVGIGLTGESGFVLEKVARLAGNPNRIIAVHVIEHMPAVSEDGNGIYVDDNLLTRLENDAQVRLKRLCDRFRVPNFQILSGHPAVELHRVAAEHDASLVAVGTHGRRGFRALLGDIANAVLHGTQTNVLAVYAPDALPEVTPGYRKILVAVDLSPEAAQVVQSAKRVCERFEATLELLTVIKPLGQVYHGIDLSGDTDAHLFEGQAFKEYQKKLDKFAEECGLGDNPAHLYRGDPAEEIQRVAQTIGADLIVLGTHGTRGPALLLGSTPNAVLHGVHTDVLAVRVGRKD